MKPKIIKHFINLKYMQQLKMTLQLLLLLLVYPLDLVTDVVIQQTLCMNINFAQNKQIRIYATFIFAQDIRKFILT